MILGPLSSKDIDIPPCIVGKGKGITFLDDGRPRLQTIATLFFFRLFFSPLMARSKMDSDFLLTLP